MKFLRDLGGRLASLRRPRRKRRAQNRDRRSRINTWDETCYGARTADGGKDPLYEGLFSAFERLSLKQEGLKKSESVNKLRHVKQGAPL